MSLAEVEKGLDCDVFTSLDENDIEGGGDTILGDCE